MVFFFFFRCEDYGRVLKTPGDDKSDAVCGNFKSSKFLALSVFEILLKKKEGDGVVSGCSYAE